MERQSLDLGLSLGLGLGVTSTAAPRLAAAGLFLNSGVAIASEQEGSHGAVAAEDERVAPCSPGSPVSSGSGKRTADRSAGSGDEDDAGCDGGGGARKKLRLSKDQAAVLEECFKAHHTLTPKQKLALANSLSLRPRQVEVWFQNRRARTKLKQTEVDCEQLKRWCDQLADHNRRLHKELAELRALKATPPAAAETPLTTLTMCLSCKRVATSSSASAANAGAPSPFPGHHPQFFCGFRDSAAGATAAAYGSSSGLAKPVRAAR
ncbi:homeobox-leucine zipper protein HOX28-like [Oryza brachyantha]|uniref:homeobox-leucine zipper protein HOX28-like n=1 Tax=Oryza brachyantha TaxID=4533 RepID=UPI001ADA9370|nr:homeobox-leucine zipper protein HOX28-like [Oryza brachyantha]